MTLLEFTKTLPADLVLAPIYRKGAEMDSGKIAQVRTPSQLRGIGIGTG